MLEKSNGRPATAGLPYNPAKEQRRTFSHPVPSFPVTATSRGTVADVGVSSVAAP